MGGNIAGIYGAQIFRSDDRPRYRRAFTIGLAILAFGVLVAGLRAVDDFFRRRRAREDETPSEISRERSEEESAGDPLSLGSKGAVVAQ
jgi:hypothetical protein